MRLTVSQLVVIWIVGLLVSFLVFSAFGVWQENKTAGRLIPLLVIVGCLVLTVTRRRES